MTLPRIIRAGKAMRPAATSPVPRPSTTVREGRRATLAPDCLAVGAKPFDRCRAGGQLIELVRPLRRRGFRLRGGLQVEGCAGKLNCAVASYHSDNDWYCCPCQASPPTGLAPRPYTPTNRAGTRRRRGDPSATSTPRDRYRARLLVPRHSAGGCGAASPRCGARSLPIDVDVGNPAKLAGHDGGGRLGGLLTGAGTAVGVVGLVAIALVTGFVQWNRPDAYRTLEGSPGPP